MKKSSLGRRSSVTAPRKTTDFSEKKNTHIPVLARSKSSASIEMRGPPTVAKRRELSTDRISFHRQRDPSTDRISQYSGSTTPSNCRERAPREMTLSSGRRSSIGGRKGDDRPINDKEWQAFASAMICEVLNSDLAGSQMFSNYGVLKQSSMTLAFFVDICSYLIKRLDISPYIDINRTNYVVELPFRLKQLNYRGKVDKSLLTTVNTMHAWPNVLAILHYLAELVQFKNALSSLEWEPLFPQNQIEAEEKDECLNFRYAVPLLHELYNFWDEPELEPLWEKNKNKLEQVIRLSGNTDLERQMNELEQEYQKYEQQCEESEMECNTVEAEHKFYNERLEEIASKAEGDKDESDELESRFGMETKLVEELEKQIINLEEETLQMDKVLNSYERGDSLPHHDYEAYKKKTKDLIDSLEFDALTLNEASDQIVDLEFQINLVKKETDKEFRKYTSLISKILEDEASIKTGLSYTRPKYGATPYNDSTALLLNRILEKFTNKLKEVEIKYGEIEEDAGNEEMKEAKLQDLKDVYKIFLNSFEKREGELMKQIEDVAGKNDEIEKEITLSEESVKDNNEKLDKLQNECEEREKQVIKCKEVCKKKLDLEFKYLKLLNERLNDLIKKEDKSCRKVKENINKMISSHYIDPLVLASFEESLAEAEDKLKNFLRENHE